LSVANHTISQMLLNAIGGLIWNPKKTFGPLKRVLFGELIDLDIENDVFRPYTFVNVTNWLKVQGWEYRENSVVVLRNCHQTENALPEFGIIQKIILEGDNVFSMLITFLNTICFCEHYHSFKVDFTTLKNVISINNLAECELLWILKNFDPFSDESFVSPRHLV
jgi:hypothetical protein